MPSKRPIFFFAFANNIERGYLPGLKKESKELRRSLLPIHDARQIELLREPQADNEDIPELLTQYKDQVSLFHYGGHGDGQHLYFEDSKGHASGLSELLQLQKDLKLVFLNACSAQEQAYQYIEAGIPCVIATTLSIIDDHASYFSKCFYDALAKELTIKEAFDTAVGALRLKTNKYETQLGNEVVAYRGIGLVRRELNEMPWRIYVHEDHQELLNWKIPKISRRPKYLTELPTIGDEIIGREDELAALYSTLEASKRVVLMNGMGGIGKTTTAIAFANLHKDEYAHIAWIEQLGDFSIDLTTNKVLTTNLDITPSGDASADAKLILNALSNIRGKSLLILDNGNEQLQQFKDYLPKAPDWHVLITSRQDLAFAKKMPLDFLSEEEALHLFYSHYDWERNDEVVKGLLRTVDYHTLTVEILAKTAQNLEVKSLKKMATLMKERGIKIGKPVDFSTVAHSKEQQQRYLFPYLEVIFQLPDINNSERHLLKQFISLPPTFFKWEEITALLKISEEEEKIWDEQIMARNMLKKKGWLLYNEEQKAYKMHRIIQDVLKEKLKPTYGDLKTLIRCVSALLRIDQTRDNPKDKFQFVVLGERILQIIPSQPEEGFARFQSNLATVYQALGNYKQAKDLFKSALQSTFQNFGEDHPSTARRRSNLALSYKALGGYEQAKNLLQSALQSNIRNFGEEHPSTARSRSSLATVHRSLGDYQQAKNLLQSALQSNIRNFGEEHPSTAISRSNLAAVYINLGDYKQAKNLLQNALQSNIQNFGEDHPSTAKNRLNLATVYQDLGDYKQAKNLLQYALQSNIQNFGEDHPSTAKSRASLALVYKALGDLEQARDLLQNALQSDTQNFGEEHPSTAKSRTYLATVYKALGDYEQAKDLLQNALQSDIQNFGEDHPTTAISRSNLALVYQDLEDYEQAKNLLQSALLSAIQNFGEDNPTTAKRYTNLATVYKDLGDYEQARNLFQKAYNTFKSLLGEHHPNTQISKQWLDSIK